MKAQERKEHAQCQQQVDARCHDLGLLPLTPVLFPLLHVSVHTTILFLKRKMAKEEERCENFICDGGLSEGGYSGGL